MDRKLPPTTLPHAEEDEFLIPQGQPGCLIDRLAARQVRTAIADVLFIHITLTEGFAVVEVLHDE